MLILRHAAYKSVPWKNGGGVTREALRVPAGDGPFQWRLSVADVVAAGPFSAFPGYRRTLVLLHGDGMALTVGGRPERVARPGDCVRFDGAAATVCRLLGGPCQDLNLMVANSLAEVAWVQAVREPLELAAARGGHALMFAIDDDLAVAGPCSELLGRGDLAVLADGERATVSSKSGSALAFCALLPDAAPTVSGTVRGATA